MKLPDLCLGCNSFRKIPIFNPQNPGKVVGYACWGCTSIYELSYSEENKEWTITYTDTFEPSKITRLN